MGKELAIHSIYRATEGEGIHIGKPQIFVRFQGCNIGCVNCDSRETWDFIPANYSMAEVIAEVEKSARREFGKINRVSITGGDPLHPAFEKGLKQLIEQLKSRKYFINLEASGSRIVREVFDNVDFISFDIKTPSTGVETPIRNIIRLIKDYVSKSQIKSVIANDKDFFYVLALKERLEQDYSILLENWFLTPSYEPHLSYDASISQAIVKLNEDYGAPFRVVAQQHKWIYGTEDLRV